MGTRKWLDRVLNHDRNDKVVRKWIKMNDAGREIFIQIDQKLNGVQWQVIYIWFTTRR